jgi:hypothetical protein
MVLALLLRGHSSFSYYTADRRLLGVWRRLKVALMRKRGDWGRAPLAGGWWWCAIGYFFWRMAAAIRADEKPHKRSLAADKRR